VGRSSSEGRRVAGWELGNRKPVDGISRGWENECGVN